MATRLKKTTLLPLAIAALALSLASGCSHHKPAASAQQNDAANVPPPDAGTDAVPQATVEDRSGQPSADVPPPPTADNSTPPPPNPDTAAAAPPAPDNAAPADQNPPDQNSAAAAPTAPVPDATTSTDQPADQQADQQATSAAPSDSTAAQAPAPAVADENGNYTVRAGDTLMKIAFDNYGDLYKWKEIYEANKDHISNPNAIPPGTVLKIQKSDTPVVVERNGDQYLIKTGDTLGTISKDVYGTTAKWKKLWDNNKQMIKDPNKIYAGFYLYYTLTSQERLGFEKRHGGQTDTAEATQTPDEPRAPASVQNAPVPAVVPTPVQTQATQAKAEEPPPRPEGNVSSATTNAAPAPATNAAREPASATPPTMDANSLTSGAAVPPPPAMVNTPAPAQHSADLNELIQKAQQEESSQAAAATAGP